MKSKLKVDSPDKKESSDSFPKEKPGDMKSLHSIIELLPGEVCVFDNDGKILVSNKSFPRHFGSKNKAKNNNDFEKLSRGWIDFVLASGMPANFKNKIDGINYQFYCFPLNWDSRKNNLAVLLSHKITDPLESGDVQRNQVIMLMNAQEMERQRIAMDLHDIILQNLSALRINLEMSLQDLDAPSKIKNSFSDISKGLLSCISDIRNIAYELRPSGLDQFSFETITRQYCEDFASQKGISIIFNSEIPDSVSLKVNTAIHLFRILQESLNNIEKHAEATEIRVVFTVGDEFLSFSISDDGAGFNVKSREKSAPSERRMGLYNMQERVKLLHGVLSIRSNPMKGTEILVEIPFEDNIDEERDND